MAQYLLAVHGSGENPYSTPEEMQQAFAAVGEFNAELQASGNWVFAGGLLPAETAKVVRLKDGAVLRTDGPYLESKEHIGGFWVVDVADDAAAIALAEKATVACQNAVEVRPFQPIPEA
jgi:hypothetical protein